MYDIRDTHKTQSIIIVTAECWWVQFRDILGLHLHVRAGIAYTGIAYMYANMYAAPVYARVNIV